MSNYHSEDCSAFVSLTSTALPRYRAIMGPFHWTVWLTLTVIYLFAIFPLTFSDKHTLKNLLETPEEMENMFWYVFGTFTNCFTFAGKTSWAQSTKIATRLLIGENKRYYRDIEMKILRFSFRFLLVVHYHYNSVLHGFYNSLCDPSCLSCYCGFCKATSGWRVCNRNFR